MPCRCCTKTIRPTTRVSHPPQNACPVHTGTVNGPLAQHLVRTVARSKNPVAPPNRPLDQSRWISEDWKIQILEEQKARAPNKKTQRAPNIETPKTPNAPPRSCVPLSSVSARAARAMPFLWHSRRCWKWRKATSKASLLRCKDGGPNRRLVTLGFLCFWRRRRHLFWSIPKRSWLLWLFFLGGKGRGLLFDHACLDRRRWPG